MSPLSAPIGELDRRWRSRARPAVLTGSAPADPAPELSLLDRAGDVLLAPIRGIEGAAQDVYGLLDTVSMDVLPDYEERVFGESKTAIGGLVEGITNFGVGFVGAGFLPLGWTAKLGRLAPVVRGAVKGAVADFAVFDGHEERLSNLMQEFPFLRNPISEYLAASPEDSEIEGRLKNAVEGLGLGAVVDLTVLSLRGLKAGRLARVAGKDPEQVERAIDKAAPPADVQAALRKLDPRHVPPQPAVAAPVPAAAGVPAPAAPAAAPAPVQATPEEVLTSFGITPEKSKELLEEVRRREAPFSHATLQGRAPLDPRVNPRDLTRIQLLEQGMERADLNLSMYQGPDGALNLVRAMEQLVEPLKATQDVARREFNAAEKLAIDDLGTMVGSDLQAFVARGHSLAQNLNDVVAQVGAYRMAMQAQTKAAYDLLIKASKSTDDKDLLLAAQAVDTSGELARIVKSFGYSAGRGLRSFGDKVPLIPDFLDREGVEAALRDRGGRDNVLRLINQAKSLMDSATDPVTRAARMSDLAQGTLGSRIKGVTFEYWMNSLLGRPTTVAVAAISNALMSVYRPLRLIAGGVLTGRSPVIQDGVREIANLVHSASDAWQATAAALRGDGRVLDPRGRLLDLADPGQQAISSQRLGLDPTTTHGQALDWIGRIVRLPSAALNAVDQFTQQLNYRAVSRSQLIREALEQGVEPERVGAVVAEQMDRLIHRGQAFSTAQLLHRGTEEAVRSGLRSKGAVDKFAREYAEQQMRSPDFARLSRVGDLALQRAQAASFTTPLTPGTLPYRYQEMVLNHWYLRLVTPFVRTPINILREAHEHTTGLMSGIAQLAANTAFPKALGLEQSRNAFVRDVLSGDARRRADAVGRLAMGGSTMVLVLTKASELTEDGFPLITGRGPVDKEERQVLEMAGWQPYSIRIGDRYVSYQRLDPLASVLGTVADIVNYARHAATEDQETVEKLVVGAGIAVAHNLTNKTYLSGLASALDMLQDPTRRGPSWIRTLAASFVPGQLAAATAATDPLMRDVQSILDAAAARTPGLSEDLPALRNVLGEPVKRTKALGGGGILNAFVPLSYRDVSDDLIARELARLEHGFTPPKRSRGGLDLGQVKIKGGTNAYDRWLELHGKVEIGGRTLRDALRRLISSRAYQRVPPESTVEVASPRIGMIQGVIEEYRQRALRQLIQEVPEIGAAEKARTDRRAELLRGRETRPQLLRSLQGGR